MPGPYPYRSKTYAQTWRSVRPPPASAGPTWRGATPGLAAALPTPSRVDFGDMFFRPIVPTQAVQSFAARSGLGGVGGTRMGYAPTTARGLQAGGRATNPATERATQRERFKRLEREMKQAAEMGEFDRADEIYDYLRSYEWLVAPPYDETIFEAP